MKRKAASWIDSLRRHVVLTAAEWRIIIFVAGTFVLGLAAKRYRAAHFDAVSKIHREPFDVRAEAKSAQSRKSLHSVRKRKPAAPETSPDAAELGD